MANIWREQTADEVYEAVRSIIMMEDEPGELFEPERWNTKFKNEPTIQEADEWMTKHWVVKHLQNQKTRKARRQAMIKKLDSSLIEGKLITVSIDQGFEIDLEYCLSIVERLRKLSRCETTKYLAGSTLTFEFFSKDKENPLVDNYNPHFHLSVETSTPLGKVKLPIKRIFLPEKNPKKWKMYWLDGRVRTLKETMDYVEGFKAEEKLEFVAKDREFKKKIGVDNTYTI